MNLRDQLKKAKLLSEKDAKRLAHEERVDRKEKLSLIHISEPTRPY